ncbi:TetR/AcrR family transcriptional regulator [Microlunatus sp. Gsoil 973]|uniref:TetR/AcrR family transcriptional regulator n=1 Tax=Microlunatus sp. Gsoil 973 TaxID=2672569 RepID=UPI00351B9A44
MIVQQPSTRPRGAQQLGRQRGQQRRRPGRPRSEQVRTAILEAAVQLAAEGGLPALSMSAIASRAGVSRVTLYKWWPSPGAILLNGLLERSRAGIEHQPGLSAREALAEQMRSLIELFTEEGPTAAAIRAVTAGAVSDPQLATDLREHWHRPRRDVAADILRRGMTSGEIRDDLDVEAAIDLLFAPIYHRLLIGHAPLGPQLVEDLLTLFDGFTATGGGDLDAPTRGRGLVDRQCDGMILTRPGQWVGRRAVLADPLGHPGQQRCDGDVLVGESLSLVGIAIPDSAAERQGVEIESFQIAVESGLSSGQRLGERGSRVEQPRQPVVDDLAVTAADVDPARQQRMEPLIVGEVVDPESSGEVDHGDHLPDRARAFLVRPAVPAQAFGHR